MTDEQKNKYGDIFVDMLADMVRDILIEEGQKDPKIKDIIRYTPSEVGYIIKKKHLVIH